MTTLPAQKSVGGIIGDPPVSKTVPRHVTPSARPGLTAATLVAGDVIALAIVYVAAVLVRKTFGGMFEAELYWQLWPALFVSIALLFTFRLYSMPLAPTEEFRRVTMIVTLTYLGLASVSFFSRGGPNYSRIIFVAAWFGSVVAVLMTRSLLRAVLSPLGWWGAPVLILGAGRVGRRLVRTLIEQPELGLKPVGILQDQAHRRMQFRGVPLLGDTSLATEIAAKHPHMRVLVVAGEIGRQRVNELLLAEQQKLRHLMIVPDMLGLATGVESHDLAGTSTLHVRHQLLIPSRRVLKRILDLVHLFLFAPLAIAVTTVIAIAIKLDSRGPVFYTQDRIGRGGRTFRVWKFRTMVVGSAEALARHLRESPDAQREWDRTQKLLHDPRITRVGRFLRRTSLDEFPQLWNVLRGEMSIVGPRPIVESEIARYGASYVLYTHVSPGITGLWQVSGRNNLPYADRIRLDVHYVRNWSIWLDLYILTRTITAVISGRGAY